MNLNPNDWKRFYLGRLFDIKKGKRLTAEDQEAGCNIYIGAIDSNNGVANHIGQKPIHEGNTISLSYNGSVGEAFYQADPYWATDDVNALYSKYEGFNELIGLFMVATIRQEKYRFSYGRKWTLENMNNTDICLPIRYNSDGSPFIDSTNFYSDEGYVPDWQFMENYIKSLHYKPLTTKHTTALKLNKDRWQEFEFGRLIKSIYKAHAYTKDDLTEQNVKLDSTLRYITRTAEDNGCELIVKNKAISYVEEGNAITIGDTTATCFYQEEKFVTGDHMIVVRANWLNTYTGLFIVTLLNNEQYRYSYGRAFLMDRVKETVLKLPICHNNDGLPIIDEAKRFSDEGFIPDWQFMEDYIKSLPYGDRI
ncbi:restriction endonuclease subunit S [Ruminococcus sp. AF37-20]|uniref:restriction endonuclease subunit S n=1 Tax=Ruminococcus sp. AF37-20 TaxID=2293178 RepID=UPI0015F2FCE8|nr:restriction endonuclease subunit S [Ruminococcus sp. AF37-20]